MRQVPILFVSDAPDLNTGLARIARDLATKVAEMPEFRVGYLAKGGIGSCKFPFIVYRIAEAGEDGQWGETSIANAARDFFRDQRGILFTVWDITRTAYIGWPQLLHEQSPTRAFLEKRNFQLWGYFPVDCCNVGDKAHHTFVEGYNRYDRKLFYTGWASNLALRSGVRGEVDWIPHGISERVQRRETTIHRNDILTVGCVATNQLRKDWGLVFGTVAFLKAQLGECKLWAHIDRPYVPGRWNLPSLVDQFGLKNDVMITTSLSEDNLMQNYSACDVTIAPGLGEGFGFPIVESLACGVPVVHGDYGGGANILHQAGLGCCTVKPVTMRIEGDFGAVRPVYNPEDFAEKCLEVLTLTPEKCKESVEHLRWDKLWPVWKCWFLKGLK